MASAELTALVDDMDAAEGAFLKVILPGIGTDTKQIVALMAMFAGALVFMEYNAVYPSLVEFRDAPPFNRVRFLMLFGTVFCLTIIERGRVVWQGSSAALSADPGLWQRYIGV